MAPENVQAIEFYPKWKAIGTPAFELLQIDVGDDYEADSLVTKLMTIDRYEPLIRQSINTSQQEADPDQKKAAREAKRSQRRQAQGKK